MLQGTPPPGMPRMAFTGPVYGATTPAIVLNLSTVELRSLPAKDACAIRPSPNARTTGRIHFFLISVLLLRFRVLGAAASLTIRDEPRLRPLPVPSERQRTRAIAR